MVHVIYTPTKKKVFQYKAPRCEDNANFIGGVYLQDIILFMVE